MAVVPIKCPNCGGVIAFDGSDFSKCPYCDSVVCLDDVADKAELERLRAENRELNSQDRFDNDFKAAKAAWKKKNIIWLCILAALNFFGFLILEYLSTSVGALCVLGATVLFFMMPPVMGASHPVLGGRNKVPESQKKKKTGITFALYGIALGVALMAMFTAAVIAVSADGEDDTDTACVINAVCDISCRE